MDNPQRSLLEWFDEPEFNELRLQTFANNIDNLNQQLITAKNGSKALGRQGLIGIMFNIDVIDQYTNPSSLSRFLMDPANPGAYNYDNSLVTFEDKALNEDKVILYVAIPIIFSIIFGLAGFLGYLWYKHKQHKKLLQVAADSPAITSKRMDDLAVEDYDGEKYGPLDASSRHQNGYDGSPSIYESTVIYA